MILSGRFTKGEEQANFVSHLVGAALALAGLVILIVFAAIKGTGIHVVSVSIFGSCMLLVYLFSCLYHGLRNKKAKTLFFLFDQIGIYIMIAGSYTPISLILIGGNLGWVIFGIEWGLALIGILQTIFTRNDHFQGVHYLKVISYVVMGLLLLIALPQLKNSLPAWGLALLLAGGAFYLLGIFFFSLKKVKYAHLVWHLFVIFGTVCHYIMIFMYVLPFKI